VVKVAIQVEVLERFGQEVALQRKWMKMWETLGERILKLPKWMQNIVLEDINTAVKNRIVIMEMIQNAKRGN